MKHVLLTRFAVRFGKDNPRRRYEREGWVDYRMDLFNRYCLPSVQMQTFKNFDWWFMVNPEFPGLTEQHLQELEQYGKIVFITSDWNEAQPEVGERLRFKYKNEWICSTRLDSDDMLHGSFMDILHEACMEAGRDQFITFKHGCVIRGDKAAPREYDVNPFVSYLEYAKPFRSVFYVDHCKANKAHVPFAVLDFPGPWWAQVCHGDNIKNVAELKVKNFEEICVPISTLRGFPV